MMNQDYFWSKESTLKGRASLSTKKPQRQGFHKQIHLFLKSPKISSWTMTVLQKTPILHWRASIPPSYEEWAQCPPNKTSAVEDFQSNPLFKRVSMWAKENQVFETKTTYTSMLMTSKSRWQQVCFVFQLEMTFDDLISIIEHVKKKDVNEQKREWTNMYTWVQSVLC